MLYPPYRPLFQPISMSSPGSAKSISNPRKAFGNLCRACDSTLPPTWAHALTPSRPCLASGLAPTSDSVIRRSGSGRLACRVVTLTALGLIAFAFGPFSSSAHSVMSLLSPSPGSLFTARLGHLTAILGWGLSVAITASPPSGLVLVFYASGKLVTLDLHPPSAFLAAILVALEAKSLFCSRSAPAFTPLPKHTSAMPLCPLSPASFHGMLTIPTALSWHVERRSYRF